MDPQGLTIVLRSVERVLVDAAGALAIYLGYQLFLHMPSRDRGTGKFELPGGISIYLSRVGPGVFFALFGAAVLGLSFLHGVSQETTRSEAPTATTAAEGGATQAAVTVTAHYSGVTPTTPDGDPLQVEAERTSVLAAIRNLNRVPAGLRPDLTARERLDIEQAISESKVRLLASVWDGKNWGPFAEFQEWVRRGEGDPAPAIRDAVGYFRAGSPGSAVSP